MYQGGGGRRTHSQSNSIFTPRSHSLQAQSQRTAVGICNGFQKEFVFFSSASAPALYDCVGPKLIHFYDLGVSRSGFVNISCKDVCPDSSFIKLNGAWLESESEQVAKSEQQKIRHTGSEGGVLLLLHKLWRRSGCHGFFGGKKRERQKAAKRDREGSQHGDVWFLLLILLIIGDYCLNAFLSSIDLCTLWSIPVTWSDLDINTWCSPLVHTVDQLMDGPPFVIPGSFLSASTTTANETFFTNPKNAR